VGPKILKEALHDCFVRKDLCCLVRHVEAVLNGGDEFIAINVGIHKIIRIVYLSRINVGRGGGLLKGPYDKEIMLGSKTFKLLWSRFSAQYFMNL
jgi:hypothetical protein